MTRRDDDSASAGRGRANLAIGVGVLAALLLGYWAGRTERLAPGAYRAATTAGLERPAGAPSATPHTHAELRMDSTRADAFAQIAREAAEEAPARDEPVRWLSDGELIERYGDLSKVDLISACEAAQASLHARSNALIFDQFERGQFRSMVVPYGTELQHQFQSEDGGLKAVGSRSIPREDDLLELQVTEVRFNDHDDLVALDREVAWINGYLLEKYAYHPILGDVARVVPAGIRQQEPGDEPR